MFWGIIITCAGIAGIICLNVCSIPSGFVAPLGVFSWFFLLIGPIWLIIAGRKAYYKSPAGLARLDKREHQRMAHEDFKKKFIGYSQDITWPSDSHGVLLKPEERVFLSIRSAILSEPRSVRHLSGAGVSVMRGVRVYGGSSKSSDELTSIDSGPLLITNKRIIFIGAKQTRDISHKKIISINYDRNSIFLNVSGRQKAMAFAGFTGNVEYDYEGENYKFNAGPELFAGVIGTIASRSEKSS